MTVLRLPTGVIGKKKAIELGVNTAKGTLIMTTDADCTMPAGWINTFNAFHIQTGAKFIAAPVKMAPSNSLRDIFQSLDFLTMQGISAAAVGSSFHMMCNGANLAYEREAFFEVNGFEGIGHIPSGDDMFLMQKIFDRYPGDVTYLKNADAIVTTPPEPSWKKFFNQRVRWSSKAAHYTDKKLYYVLLLTYVVNTCFLVLAIAAIVDLYWLPFLLMFLLAKILIEFPFVNSVAIFFGQKRLMRYFPFLQPLHILYVVIAGWLGRFGSYEWKSRIIKNKGREKLAKQ
jgi:cellulose synthase/poly-beta-1,6-N-acetylglucosamine synthase-like glycosyltransferase